LPVHFWYCSSVVSSTLVRCLFDACSTVVVACLTGAVSGVHARDCRPRIVVSRCRISGCHISGCHIPVIRSPVIVSRLLYPGYRIPVIRSPVIVPGCCIPVIVSRLSIPRVKTRGYKHGHCWCRIKEATLWFFRNFSSPSSFVSFCSLLVLCLFSASSLLVLSLFSPCSQTYFTPNAGFHFSFSSQKGIYFATSLPLIGYLTDIPNYRLYNRCYKYR